LSYRLQLIERLGVDVCLVIRFTKRFSQLSPERFIKQYLVERLMPKEIFVGYDFRFGKDREGNLALFSQLAKKFGFKVNIVKAVKTHHEVISSTRIRNLIREGHLKKASELLGRLVSVVGVVQPGDKRGKGLGFPTANIYPTNETLPPAGVYAVYVVIDGQRCKGMANIGYRPSFQSHPNQINLEVNIFNFRQNIYGKEIIVEFVEKIRDEKVFYTKESLVRQLESDEKKIRRIFKRVPVHFLP
ncbi:MAG TPA: riboflavin biosynthesis protein RibF, partial [Candidatus Omnitrophota bacterium]|nr:riboflavin biosynthesis protein RibF [Candidatus Omnitrophota bacterium]